MKKVFLLLLLFSTFSTVCLADAPNKIRYSGRLKSYQTPVNNTVKINFQLYNSENATIPFWQSGDKNIQVTSGVFNYVLEPEFENPNITTGKKVDLRNGLYLQLVVNDVPLLPKEEIMPQVYALYANNGVPPGTIIAFAGRNPPKGYLPCDGTTRPVDNYRELAEVLVGLYGNSASLGSTFTLPNFQGMFLRGAGEQEITSNYPNIGNVTTKYQATLAQFQGDAIRNITGNLSNVGSPTTGSQIGVSGAFVHNGDTTNGYQTGTSSNWIRRNQIRFDASRVVPTSTVENRPANYAVNYYIKY